MITNKIQWATEISPEETLNKALAGATLVDLRELIEVDELVPEVPNLINIPLSKFEERFMELPHDKELVMVCKNGGQSLRATYFMMHHGYTNVVNMQYGLIRWIENGLPTKGNIYSLMKDQKRPYKGNMNTQISVDSIPRRN